MKEYLLDYEDTDQIASMAVASYYKSAEMENKFVVPNEFRQFAITRNAKREITKIKDDRGNVMTGPDLSKLLVYFALSSKGYAVIIIGKRTDDTIEALAVPGGVQIMEEPSKGKKKIYDKVKVVYTYRNSYTLYAPPDVIAKVLGLDYITLAEVPNLLKALNSLSSKEDIRSLDLDTLIDFTSLQTALGDEEAKDSRKNFLETLLAASTTDASVDERIVWFQENTAYRLAHRLKLRLPHSGPCFTSLRNQLVTPRALSSLGDEEVVLMSNNFISQKEYKELLGDPGEFKVYVDSANLGAKKNNRFVKLTAKTLYSKQNVVNIVTAITNANAPTEKTSNVPDATETTDKVEDEVQISIV